MIGIRVTGHPNTNAHLLLLEYGYVVGSHIEMDQVIESIELVHT